MDDNLGLWLSDLKRFISFNLKHYPWALFGIGLKLDPDYPMVTNLAHGLMSDSVLEYRLYGLFAPWCAFLALALSKPWFIFLGAFWTVLAWKRTAFYASPLAFWRQAYLESPNKQRVRIRLAEELSHEIERLDKAGENWTGDRIQNLIIEAVNLQELITKGKP